MKRTFIAVKTDAGKKLTEAAQELRSQLKNESVKWVDMKQIHITLSFIGNTSEESIRDISAMLREKCVNFGDIEFKIKGMGVFRNISDPRVIWAGINDHGRLDSLQHQVKKGLDEAGIETGDHDFKPHLTLGRIKWLKNKGILESVLAGYKDVLFQEVKVSKVIFYESILHERGPEYIPISIVNL